MVKTTSGASAGNGDWDEGKHPRDPEGQFSRKPKVGGGIPKAGAKSHAESPDALANGDCSEFPGEYLDEIITSANDAYEYQGGDDDPRTRAEWDAAAATSWKRMMDDPKDGWRSDESTGRMAALSVPLQHHPDSTVGMMLQDTLSARRMGVKTAAKKLGSDQTGEDPSAWLGPLVDRGITDENRQRVEDARCLMDTLGQNAPEETEWRLIGARSVLSLASGNRGQAWEEAHGAFYATLGVNKDQYAQFTLNRLEDRMCAGYPEGEEQQREVARFDKKVNSYGSDSSFISCTGSTGWEAVDAEQFERFSHASPRKRKFVVEGETYDRKHMRETARLILVRGAFDMARNNGADYEQAERDGMAAASWFNRKYPH